MITTKYCIRHRPMGAIGGAIVAENRNKVKKSPKLISCGRPGRGGRYSDDSPGNQLPAVFSRPAGTPVGLSVALGRLGTQAPDLAARQRDADLADPIQLYPVDRLGVKAVEVDQIRRFSPLDRLQITLTGLEPHRCFLAIEARQREALLAVNHDNIAIFVLR